MAQLPGVARSHPVASTRHDNDYAHTKKFQHLEKKISETKMEARPTLVLAAEAALNLPG